MKTSIVVVDDHVLMAQALSELISNFEGYETLYEVSGGGELKEKIDRYKHPDIVLLDINMPEMDGFEVAVWLSKNYPEIKVLALSMNDKEEAIVKMLRSGARGYLLKGCRSGELKQALDAISESGYYYTEFVAKHLVSNLNSKATANKAVAFELNERELSFLKFACSDLTYVEIADRMCVSPRTVDGYREVVFQKMDVKSRVGMVIEAIRNKLVQI